MPDLRPVLDDSDDRDPLWLTLRERESEAQSVWEDYLDYCDETPSQWVMSFQDWKTRG